MDRREKNDRFARTNEDGDFFERPGLAEPDIDSCSVHVLHLVHVGVSSDFGGGGGARGNDVLSMGTSTPERLEMNS